MRNSDGIEMKHSAVQNKALLEPYRVLDLTDEKGLYCGALLGSLGADIVKVEKPGGDPSRNIGPFYHHIPDPERSLYWLSFNTNKRGITLNIGSRDGRNIFKELVKQADVVIESFDPGYMGKLGLGYADLEKMNSRIVMTSISHFGQSGPYVDHKFKASDLTCWALGGMLFSSGSFGRGPVHISHVSQSYVLASIDAAWSTVMALFWRGTSGEGQHIDVSIVESVLRASLFQYVDWKVRGIPYEKVDNNFTVPPVRAVSKWVWELRDGYLSFHLTGGQWGEHQVKPVIEWMEEEGMADEFLLNINWGSIVFEELPLTEIERIRKHFEDFFKTKCKEEVIKEALMRGIPLDVVCNPEDVLKHPQLKDREYWQQLEEPDLGVCLPYPAHFCKASETESKIWRPSPRIGEHNEEIYQEIGLTKDDLVVLRQGGII